MEEGQKKVVMIVVIVICLALAGALAFKNFGGGGSGTSATARSPQPMLCVNPDCGHIFDMTAEERREIMRARGRQMRRGGPPVFTCPQCSEESAYQATKCAKCSTVFIHDYTSQDFADRCPDPSCGYSAIEERRKQKSQ
ncbi:MAG: hypothetical protein ACYTFK_08650 [Planctomycetota bacterium]|jgi:hypothetical protein